MARTSSLNGTWQEAAERSEITGSAHRIPDRVDLTEAVHGPRILVVDDDDELRTMLVRLLAADGYRPVEAADGAGTLKGVTEHQVDLVLLDVMLADEDGFDVLAKLRRTSDLPVIMLSGKGQEVDRVVGLKLGADDYVTKPFFPAELSARIASVLRRSRPRETSPGAHLQFGDLGIDMKTREITLQGQVVETTHLEFDLLAYLARFPRQVFSRNQLLEHVWESSAEWQGEATVTEHIRRIRRKIEADPDNPRWVRTVRGVGYRFEP